MHVGKRYKLASISLLIFVECWAWHLGAASAACHIAAYIYYMYPSCFLAGEAYPVHISFYISIASSKSFSRPHFYFLHFSISPFLHFSISSFPFPHFHFLISISFVPGFVTTLPRSFAGMDLNFSCVFSHCIKDLQVMFLCISCRLATTPTPRHLFHFSFSLSFLLSLAVMPQLKCGRP